MQPTNLVITGLKLKIPNTTLFNLKYVLSEFPKLNLSLEYRLCGSVEVTRLCETRSLLPSFFFTRPVACQGPLFLEFNSKMI